jgi:type VI secretion system VasD/TssJ family lipoprotein
MRQGVFAVLLAASACASATPEAKAPEKCPDQNVTVSILASPAVNPTPTGEPRAVVVRMYELKNDARLFNATFDGVWKDDKNTLGDDIVKSEEQLVYPGTRADFTFARPEPVEHVAVVALFQNPQGRSWFTSMDLPPIPEAGKCGAKACGAEDEDCSARSVVAPRLAFWLDGSKVDDGVEHLDDFPKIGPMKGRKAQ